MKGSFVNRHLTLSCALALSCTLGAGLPAHAGDNNPRTSSVPRALPYEGVLAVDGVPLNGTLAVTFRLWGADAPVAGEVALFEETLQVPFVNGRFSVLLGQAQQGLANAIFDADALYVGITVGGTTLRGRQRIVPVPYALWAAKAADFTVENNLSVAGEVSVAGPLNALGGVRGNVTGDVAATSLALTGVADVFGDAAEINFCAGNVPGRCEAFRVPTDGFVYVQGKPDTCNAGVGLKDNPILVYLWTQGNLPPPEPRATVMNCGTALVPARRGELAVVLATRAFPLQSLFYPLGR
jgi:hypothetical protein